MHRIDTVGATANNLFQDATANTDGTVVDSDWLNGVQEELINILNEGGITPDKGDKTQVYEALLVALAGKVMGGIGDFGFKEGPTSFNSQYINTWNVGGGQGSSLDATSNTDSILVNTTGYYSASYWQRADGTSSVFGGLAEDGSRSALEGRSGSMWNHDHSEDSSTYCQSHYLGILNSGERVTAGPSASGGFQFATSGFTGSIRIIRIR